MNNALLKVIKKSETVLDKLMIIMLKPDVIGRKLEHVAAVYVFNQNVYNKQIQNLKRIKNEH